MSTTVEHPGATAPNRKLFFTGHAAATTDEQPGDAAPSTPRDALQLAARLDDHLPGWRHVDVGTFERIRAAVERIAAVDADLVPSGAANVADLVERRSMLDDAAIRLLDLERCTIELLAHFGAAIPLQPCCADADRGLQLACRLSRRRHVDPRWFDRAARQLEVERLRRSVDRGAADPTETARALCSVRLVEEAIELAEPGADLARLSRRFSPEGGPTEPVFDLAAGVARGVTTWRRSACAVSFAPDRLLAAPLAEAARRCRIAAGAIAALTMAVSDLDARSGGRRLLGDLADTAADIADLHDCHDSRHIVDLRVAGGCPAV